MLDFSETQIWETIAESGFGYHPAYDAGCSRVSCSICVLASEHDIRIGAQYNPDLARKYLEIEAKIGHRFWAGRSLEEILRGLELPKQKRKEEKTNQ